GGPGGTFGLTAGPGTAGMTGHNRSSPPGPLRYDRTMMGVPARPQAGASRAPGEITRRIEEDHVSDELNPVVPDSATAEGPETESEEPIKQRKNGLYPGVSDELAENMKSGWADTELRDLQPIEQAAETERRRAALSAR